MIFNSEELAKYIDCTLLKADAIAEDIKNICSEAKENGYASVVVNPCFVNLAASLLEGSAVRVGTVVGFPLGANTTTEKCFETINNIVNGATEIDFVINIGYIKSGEYDELFRDVKAVVLAAKRGQLKKPNTTILTKMIIEACYLTDEEKRMACKIAERAEVDYVKTSTGFANGGASVEDVKLLRRTLPSDIGIKASGGIRSLSDANALIEVGATRIGTSNAAKILKEYKETSKQDQQAL